MPTVESLPSVNGGTTNSSDLNRDRSRSRSNDNKLNDDYSRPKRADDDLPLSFASFYYSLKVLKGKGTSMFENIMK